MSGGRPFFLSFGYFSFFLFRHYSQIRLLPNCSITKSTHYEIQPRLLFLSGSKAFPTREMPGKLLDRLAELTPRRPKNRGGESDKSQAGKKAILPEGTSDLAGPSSPYSTFRPDPIKIQSNQTPIQSNPTSTPTPTPFPKPVAQPPTIGGDHSPNL